MKNIPHGNGTLTTPTFTYSGSFKNGKVDGKGVIEDFNTRLVYDGEMSNNQMTGFGKLTFPDGGEYEGAFLNGMFHGDGQFIL